MGSAALVAINPRITSGRRQLRRGSMRARTWYASTCRLRHGDSEDELLTVLRDALPRAGIPLRRHRQAEEQLWRSGLERGRRHGNVHRHHHRVAGVDVVVKIVQLLAVGTPGDHTIAAV